MSGAVVKIRNFSRLLIAIFIAIEPCKINIRFSANFYKINSILSEGGQVLNQIFNLKVFKQTNYVLLRAQTTCYLLRGSQFKK